jgi:hypothetical protein
MGCVVEEIIQRDLQRISYYISVTGNYKSLSQKIAQQYESSITVGPLPILLKSKIN